MTRRVVYFTDSAFFGGTEQVLLTLLRGLERGWEALLLVHAAPGILPLVHAATAEGIPVRVVPRMTGRAGAGQLPGFASLLRRERADVFHAHLTMPLACKYGLVGAALAGVPAIVASEHLFVDVPYLHSRAIERLVAPGVDRYVAVSHAVAAALAQHFPFMTKKIRVVHNGIPLDDAGGETRIIARTAAPDCPPVLLTTARLTAQKGIGYLLRAAAELPGVHFAIAGDGPERARLETQARAIGVSHRVQFLGQRNDIPTLLANCFGFVLPSLYEGLPLSVLEAMAAAKPVIATRVGGTAEAVLDNETGFLVPPADVPALVGALRALVDDKARARALGAAGRRRAVQEFSAQRMVAQTTALYEQILRGKGR